MVYLGQCFYYQFSQPKGEKMSAWIVSKSHIDALVLLGVRLPYPTASPLRWSRSYDTWDSDTTCQLNTETQDQVGKMLVECCVASVSYRYEDSDLECGLPGPIDTYYKRAYAWDPVTVCPSAVEGLKLISCYEYQSCEHPEWMASEGRSFCHALRDKLIMELPGYEAADWEHEEEVEETERARLLEFSPKGAE